MQKRMGVNGLLVLAVLLAPAANAWAADEATPGRSWVRLGGFHPSIDSRAQVDHPRSGNPGTDIDFEGLLGLPKRKTLPTLLVGTRVGDDWRVEFEYFALKRDGRETASLPIVFDDTTYNASATISSEFASNIYRVVGGYSFYRTDEAEAGVTVGLHLTDFKIALEGEGSIDGGVVAARSEKKDKMVPLPTIGAYGSLAFAPQWSVTGRADLLSLKVRHYKGSLFNLQANLLYQLTPQVALGLGYRYDDYTLKATRDDWNGKVEYKFSGPQVILEGRF